MSSSNRFSAFESALDRVHGHIQKGTIVVGMSGGVDSAVSAALLKAKGYDVVGLFMKNWNDEKGCSAEVDATDVARVATDIGIPFYTVNFAKEYWEEVFEQFLRDLQRGLTPNPDILCNREIKFHKLLEKSLSIGGEALATGHYAANRCHDHRFCLECAFDDTKDQTYFLYTATQHTLSKTLFPLANFKKTEIRAFARTLNLSVADKKDSTGICFIGEKKFRDFIKPYLGLSPGPMMTPEGAIIGTHQGLAYYTIGQRRGMGIGGQGEAWFVVGKDVSNNHLIVAQGANHPALYADDLTASEVHWIAGTPPPFPFRCTAKIRYRQTSQPCVVTATSDTSVHVTFDSAQRAITPQQSIVFYKDHTCLGGGFIHQRGPSHAEGNGA
jgi:tRNA-specific 2-thiouridylase